jgi:cysteine desulfurase / selenocysteine lyase
MSARGPAPFDVARARRETPGCASVLHLNNAGAALMPAPVLEAVRAHLALEERCGGYEAAEQVEARLAAAYGSVARLLGCKLGEVAFAENATRAWDLAFYSLRFGAGDRILTSVAEYASNYIAFLQVTRRTGALVEPVPNDATGQLDVAALERMLDARVKLIAITHVPTNGGLVNPAAAVGRVARAASVPYLLDACQSAGQLPLDVEALGCDLLSATGRKYLRGPRGTGFLYVRERLLERLEPPFLDLHAATWTAPDAYVLREDARRFETWEFNVADRLGLAAAVDYALGWGLPAIEARVKALAEALRAQLAALPGVRVHDQGRERCGIVTFTAQGREPAALMAALAARGINVDTSSPAGALLDMRARGLTQLVRASVHYYNSEAELERFVAELRELL